MFFHILFPGIILSRHKKNLNACCLNLYDFEHSPNEGRGNIVVV